MSESTNTLKQPLTAEEQRVYGTLFREIDKDGSGVVIGEDARATFEKSGLPPLTLGEIWQIADPTNLGYLTEFAFSVALRLIGHVQNGAKPDRTLVDISGPLARFQQPTSPTTLAAQPSAYQFNSLPSLSNHDISKFAQLFAKNAPSGVISGEQARNIFLKAKLPTNILSQIWALSDQNNRGQLTRDEFIIAMFLIQGTIQGTIKQLPQIVPQTTWDQVKFFQSPSMTGTGTATFSPQTTGNRPQVSRVPSSFGNAANDWTISPQKRAQFDNIFEGLDKDSKDVLGPNEVASFLMTSKLPQDILATIWDLADIHNTGEFTKDEFAIAMFLVQKKIAGAELPDIVPDSLLPGSHPAVQQQQQSQATPQYAAPQQKSIPRIPSRDTKPQSSLNDLVDLNDAFASPVPSGSDSRSVSNSTVNFTPAVGAPRAFVPTSSFGQGLTEKSVSEAPVQAPVQAAVQAPESAAQPQQRVASPAVSAQRTPSFQAPQPLTSSTGSAVSGAASLAGTGISKSTALAGAVGVGAVGLAGAAIASGAGLFSKSANNDLLADANPEISGKLSQATTDMANLSNQIGSLTSQTTQLHDKRSRAERELAKMTALRNDIEAKLSKLRVSYEQEVKQTEQVEALLTSSKQETEQLRQEASVAEAQFNQVQAQLHDLQAELEESQKTNSSLKERLGTLNAEQIETNKQLERVQNEVRQSKGLLAVNSEQVHVAELKSSEIQAEIAALLYSAKELDTQHENYTQKQLQLDTVKQEIEEKERQFAERMQQHEQFEIDFRAKEEELQVRAQQQQENELLIQQQEERVQQLYADLQERQRQWEEAEQQLQQQQIDYAQRVQQFTEKQISDATSGFAQAEGVKSAAEEELPSEFSKLESSSAAIIPGAVAGGIGGAAIASVVDGATESEKTNTDFSSPTANTTEQGTSVTSNQDEQYPTDLDIERPHSTTSSVQNNAPQSLRGDDIEDTSLNEPIAEESASAEEVLGKNYNSRTVRVGELPSEDPNSGAGSFEIVDGHKPETEETFGAPTATSEDSAEASAEADTIEASIPGAFEPTSEDIVSKEEPTEAAKASSFADEVSDEFGELTPAEVETETKDEFDDLVPAENKGKNTYVGHSEAATPVAPTNVKPSIDEEFPPIQELDLDESDSTDDEEFHETSENLPNASPVVPVGASVPSAFSKNLAVDVPDEFDFDGLEEAQEERQGDFDDEFEQENFNDELEGTAFYGADGSQGISSSAPPPEENEEWEQIFAGFGNQAQSQAPINTAFSQPQPIYPQQKAPASSVISPRIATTPRSLAIQELTGMGFSREEALAALEKEKWNLEAATNYLLDNA
jgi:epidermal growth factor receptor substrate 15